MSRSLVWTVVAAGLAALAADSAPEPWPVFRGGPAETGVLPASALPSQLDVLWRFTTKDQIEGAPAVADGVVYVGSEDEHLYAVDLASGVKKWEYKCGPIKASPAVRGGYVYVGDGDGLFHCVDVKTGQKKWTFETGAEIASGADFAGDMVLFGSYDETLYCLDKDGKPVWKFKTQGPVNGSPAVVEGRTFVAGCDSSLHILDTAKGTEVASVDLGGQAAATAAVSGDRLYVGTMTNQVLAVDWKKPEVAWTFERKKGGQAFYGSAAVTDALVVVGSRDKRVYALDRKTGEEKWSFTTGNRVDASPVVVGGRVFIGSLDGKFYALELNSGRKLKEWALDGPVTGSPAVADGRLLVGTQNGTLYCFGEKK